MAVVSPERIRGDIVRLCHRGLGVRDFSIAAARVVRRVVPFKGTCVLTMDPATLLPTGHVIEDAVPEAAMARMSENEYLEEDFNKFAELARKQDPAASLSDVTAGDLERSPRYRALLRPHGFEDELRAALVSDSGMWGGMVLLREQGTPHFTAADVRLVASLSDCLAEGMRRAILFSSLAAGEEGEAGLIVLGDDDSIEMANSAAQRWLRELGEGGGSDEHLPLVIRTVASRARSAVASDQGSDASIARARVRAPSGRWLLVHGSALGDGPEARAAVILEAARSPELAPLIAEAHGLTERERVVTQLVVRGLPTSEIASQLHLSPYTVQDHLKSIFDKVEVRTRGELVARLFFQHYAPRLAGGARIGSNGWFAAETTSYPPPEAASDRKRQSGRV